MTRPEFATVMAYLSTAINKPLSEAAHEVYFDLLGDLPLRVLQLAAKRVALEHKWTTFPTVAELREAAIDTMRGEVAELSAADAWAMAWRAAGRIDLDVEGSADRALRGLPSLVIDAMKAFGISALCYGKEPVGVVRGQFMKIYEQLAARNKREALLPLAVRKAIAEVGAMRPEVKRLANDIGRIPEGS